jgi:hypothetical protein
MPQYILLINEPAEGGLPPSEQEAQLQRWGAYSQSLAESGAMVGGDRLRPADTATTLRVRDGETVLSDGPFAETKEVLGGYYIIDVPSLDDAIKWAGRMPHVSYGSVEVRPIWPMGGADSAATAGAQAGAQA